MVKPIDEMVRDVRVCIDQNVLSDSLLNEGDQDTLTLNEIIRSKLLEAAERVEKAAPAYMLEEGHLISSATGTVTVGGKAVNVGAVVWGDQESGHVYLPLDFMRLIVFKMSDWERAVYTAIDSGDPEYELQRQRVKALRGTAQRPVCAIVNRAEGKALEFYSCKSEAAHIEQGLYLPYPKNSVVVKDGISVTSIDLCERCYQAIVYMAASLTLLTLGEVEKAAAMTEVSNGLLR